MCFAISHLLVIIRGHTDVGKFMGIPTFVFMLPSVFADGILRALYGVGRETRIHGGKNSHWPYDTAGRDLSESTYATEIMWSSYIDSKTKMLQYRCNTKSTLSGLVGAGEAGEGSRKETNIDSTIMFFTLVFQ